MRPSIIQSFRKVYIFNIEYGDIQIFNLFTALTIMLMRKKLVCFILTSQIHWLIDCQITWIWTRRRLIRLLIRIQAVCIWHCSWGIGSEGVSKYTKKHLSTHKNAHTLILQNKSKDFKTKVEIHTRQFMNKTHSLIRV